jgi:ferritin-like metal-binding protein YciE
MFERLNTPQDLFGYRLGAALTMEREIVEMLDELIEEAHEEPLKQALSAHQEETRGHVANVEQAFTALGWEVDDSPCPTVRAMEKEGKSNIKKTGDSLVDSVILAGVLETEHHEIAVYEDLILHAQAMGRDDVARLLQVNCEQEQQTLQKAKGLAQQIAIKQPAGATA